MVRSSLEKRGQWLPLILIALLVPGARAQSPDPSADSLPTLPRPRFLQRPLETPLPEPPAAEDDRPFVQAPVEPPLGFTGRSSVVPREAQEDEHFVPVEDRWRVGFPEWDRYGRGHPFVDDYPYVEGHWWDPYNQNVLKGDYPILGQNTFLNVTASSFSITEGHQVPTATTPFESTVRPFEEEFFQKPGQFFYQHYFALSFDLFHGDGAFKPADWRVKFTPVFNVNDINVNELAVVNPNVLNGTTRGRTYFTVQEYFIETKIADTSPDYDFISTQIGSQFFTSDFRGFIFSDTNRAVRIFGTRMSNRDQFNLLYFRQADKDTNSGLNTFNDRGQDIVIANYYRQDFIFPGYTMQASFHYNHDRPNFHFDNNNSLVRPDPTGIFQIHDLNVFYLGLAGDGHINRCNISNAFYWALGRDSNNPIAGNPQDISAQMAAAELSYDRDWVRFRTSFFYGSGDKNVQNSHATGFDAIFDDPNFAGGRFSFWQRQAIRLFGTNLTNRGSLLADLRSSKIQGQSNFVNPGVWLINAGVDLDLTPKLRMINNANYLWFDETEVLNQFVFQSNIHRPIGFDLSTGFEYRPFLNNNVIAVLGASMLLPGQGFRDLYNNLDGTVGALGAVFLELALAY